MKFLFISIGTRGDMEPFLATAEALKNRGHDVVCAFPEQFQNLAEDSGIPCHALSKEFIELIGTEEGQIAMGGNISLLRKIQMYYWIYSLPKRTSRGRKTSPWKWTRRSWKTCFSRF